MRLVWCDLPDDSYYEVLDARGLYGRSAPYYLRFFLGGVLITEKPYQTEVAARTQFERAVERKTPEGHHAAKTTF